jgi:hypothetical protein
VTVIIADQISLFRIGVIGARNVIAIFVPVVSAKHLKSVRQIFRGPSNKEDQS